MKYAQIFAIGTIPAVVKWIEATEPATVEDSK